jgi:polygalacturonase
MLHHRSSFTRLPRIVSAGCLLVLAGCINNDDIAAYSYVCGDERPLPNMDAPPGQRCGEEDVAAGLLPPEPYVGDGRGWPPADPPAECILKASRVTPPEGRVLPEPLLKTKEEEKTVLDTVRIQTALDNCTVVKLVTDGANNAFLSARLQLDGGKCDVDPNNPGACMTCSHPPLFPDPGQPCGKTLWIDKGVTLFMSRNTDLFQRTGNCGALGVNDSSACWEFIAVRGGKPELIGEGIIDGQGGEPGIGKDYSWWQASYALRAVNGSIGQPNMINLEKGTRGFILYRLTLNNAAKFHVKLTSSPPEGTAPGICETKADRGKGYIVWGITLLTPSKFFNSAGYQLTPSWARNTDGVDPGTTDIAYCGTIACNMISTGDDQIAIKGGHWVENLSIAHNAFGTGHGMSIGSETYGGHMADGVLHRGVQKVDVWDLTIDADSRPVGHEAHAHDFNGIRVKSDESRGGLVDQITYEDVCLRDMVNGILISTAYNPLFAGMSYPDFRVLKFKNIRGVTCKALTPAVVTMEGYNATLRPDITLDNVQFDNINPTQSVAAEYAKFWLGPGAVNVAHDLERFRGVNVMGDTRTGEFAPKQCSFPKLPAPHEPPGWLH